MLFIWVHFSSPVLSLFSDCLLTTVYESDELFSKKYWIHTTKFWKAYISMLFMVCHLYIKVVTHCRVMEQTVIVSKVYVTVSSENNNHSNNVTNYNNHLKMDFWSIWHFRFWSKRRKFSLFNIIRFVFIHVNA